MALNGIVDDATEYSLRIICVDLLDRQCDVQVFGVGVTTPKPTKGWSTDIDN